jgi:hypothetical protein
MNITFDERQSTLRKILALARMTEANGSTPSEAATAVDLFEHLRHKYDFSPEEIASGTATRGLSKLASAPKTESFRPLFKSFYQLRLRVLFGQKPHNYFQIASSTCSNSRNSAELTKGNLIKIARNRVRFRKLP